MSKFSDATMFDDPLAGEIQYKPISPAAMWGLFFGVAAVLAAVTVVTFGWGFVIVPVVAVLVSIRGIASVKRYDMKGGWAAITGLVCAVLSATGGVFGYSYYLAHEVPPGYREIHYEALQPKGEEATIAETAKELDGQTVYIKGYVYPTDKQRDIKSFVLCRDKGTCCFGGQPKLTDMVEVRLKDPLRLNFTSDLRGIGGKFRVAAEKSGPIGTVLYHIDDADVLQ